MSYILTALRKAEKERESAKAVSAEGFLAGATAPAPGRAVGRKWLLGAAAVSIVAAVAYLLVRPPAVPEAGPPSAAKPAVVETAAPIGHEPESVAVKGPERAAPVTEESTKSPAPASPEPVSRPLPDLDITGYIFFEGDPDRSKLFVDGIVYRRGSRLDQGLILTGFARDHITVTHYGTEHRLAVD